jgi:hypothetical protein
MRTFLLGAAISAMLGASGAFAASILNNDTVSHQFTVAMEGKSRAIQVNAGRERKNICPSGCELSMGEAKWLLKGTEQVVIEGGKVRIRHGM